MRFLQLSAAHACVLSILLLDWFTFSSAGRFVEFLTDGGVKLKLMNDHGVPISGKTTLLFEVKACANAYFVLSQTSSFTTNNGKYFMVMLGTTKTKRMNGIKDSCFKCSTFNKHAVKTTTDCDKFKQLFVRWNNKGQIAIGDGTDPTGDVFLEYTSKKEFDLNFLNVMSQRNNATWRFRVDSPPKFTAPQGHGATVIQVAEDTEIDSEIYALKAWDPEDDNVTFTMGDKHTDVFKISDNNSLVLNQSLDYETTSFYSIDISVSDGFNSVPVAMAIRVTDVNDEPPTLNYNDDVMVPEEMPVGFVISGLFSATDRDLNDNMTFYLEGAESSFLNLSNNVLRVNQRIDHDGTDGHASLNGLTFRVFDSKNHESNITKNITIMDMNDNSPKFANPMYTVNITENSTSDIFLLHLEATDSDSGGNGQVVYSLAGDNSTTQYFKLNGSELSVDGDRIDLEAMDEENGDQLLLTVVAVDTPEFEQPQTGSATIRLKILSKNEYDPEWLSPKVDKGSFPETNISETVAPLTTVVALKAKDEDRAEDGQITYSIVSTKTANGEDRNSTFWVDTKTGELKTIAVLDSDSSTGGTSYYDVILMAADSGTDPRNTTASLRILIGDVNDNAPIFNQSVLEVPLTKAVKKGEVVASLEVSDPDGDNMTFRTGGLLKHMFEYDGKEIKAKVKIDASQNYFVILTASDGEHETTMTAVIGGDVGKNTTSPSLSGSSGGGGGGGGPLEVESVGELEVPEEYPVGLPLPRPFTIEGGGSLTYSLSGDDSNMFDIDSTTGVMKLKQRVDFDSNSTKTLFNSLTLTVTDSKSKKKEVNITLKFIDINDNEPTFDQSLILANATESSSNDTLVTELTYTDLDQGDNGNVTLNISSGSPAFRLEGNKLYVDGGQLDYESLDSGHTLTVTVHAVDSPASGQAKTGQATVIVKILPLNEHSPEWVTPNLQANSTFPNKSLTDAVGPLVEVGNFTASDQDGGLDGHVTYSLVSAISENGENVTEAFIMNSDSGVLLTTAHVDSGARVPSSYYDVVVAAQDKGSPPNTVQGNIRVLVDVKRVVSPLMKTAHYVSKYIAEVFENVTVGYVVKNFTGAFPGSENTTLTVTGKWNESFGFDGLTLKVLKQLDYEDTRIHFVDISISDGSSDGSSDETTVMSINVVDVKDEAPVINVLAASIPEELPPLSVVGNIFDVTDKDYNDNLTYTLSGDDAKYFNMDSSTGQLSMKEKIDRDGDKGVRFLDQLVLTVTDSAGLTTNSSLNLTVLDLNDNTPALSGNIDNINVTENSTSDAVLTTLMCEDPDEGQNGNCSIELVTTSSVITLNGTSLVADASKIDYETLKEQLYMYRLVISLTDHPDGSDPRTSTTTIEVKVRIQGIVLLCLSVFTVLC